MAYMLRSKSRLLVIRDGAVMRDVGPREWVRFDVLPANMVPGHDPDCDIREVDAAPVQAELIDVVPVAETAPKKSKRSR